MLSEEEKYIYVLWEYLLINLNIKQSNSPKISAKRIFTAAGAQKDWTEVIHLELTLKIDLLVSY